jgi:dihydroxyacid dehydratase/phosphogluconate dehydratase
MRYASSALRDTGVGDEIRIDLAARSLEPALDALTRAALQHAWVAPTDAAPHGMLDRYRRLGGSASRGYTAGDAPTA